MKYTRNQNLLDIIEIQPEIFYDFRGEYIETWNKKYYEQINKMVKQDIEWVQDDVSVSKKHVFRGLHGDYKTWKLIQCLQGDILVAIVDMRKESPTLHKHILITINDKNRKQLLIPPGFANGHLVMSDSCIFSYKQSTYYDGMDKQFTVRGDDPLIGIKWPIQYSILSSRDKYAKNIHISYEPPPTLKLNVSRSFLIPQKD